MYLITCKQQVNANDAIAVALGWLVIYFYALCCYISVVAIDFLFFFNLSKFLTSWLGDVRNAITIPFCDGICYDKCLHLRSKKKKKYDNFITKINVFSVSVDVYFYLSVTCSLHHLALFLVLFISWIKFK